MRFWRVRTPHVARGTWQPALARCTWHVARGTFLQRDIPVLLWRVLVALGVERGQGRDQLGARLARADHFVHEATCGGDVRVGELLLELGDPPGARRVLVGCRV